MDRTIIATYYKTKKLATEEMKRKNKIWGRNTFEVLSFKNGFLVCSKRQVEKLNQGAKNL